jgi:hypothetical protein
MCVSSNSAGWRHCSHEAPLSHTRLAGGPAVGGPRGRYISPLRAGTHHCPVCLLVCMCLSVCLSVFLSVCLSAYHLLCTPQHTALSCKNKLHSSLMHVYVRYCMQSHLSFWQSLLLQKSLPRSTPLSLLGGWASVWREAVTPTSCTTLCPLYFICFSIL